MRAFGKKPAGVIAQRRHQNRGYETLLIFMCSDAALPACVSTHSRHWST